MTQISISHNGREELPTLEVGTVFMKNNKLYMVVDTENQDNSDYCFDIIDLETGKGLYTNDLRNVSREDYSGLREFQSDLELKTGIKIIDKLEISIS